MQTDAPFWDSLVFAGIDDVDVETVTAAFGTVEVVARGRVIEVECPDCGRFPDRVHDRYRRRLRDLPLADQGFAIRVTVRCFVCGMADRPRRTFAEPFSGRPPRTHGSQLGIRGGVISRMPSGDGCSRFCRSVTSVVASDGGGAFPCPRDGPVRLQGPRQRAALPDRRASGGGRAFLRPAGARRAQARGGGSECRSLGHLMTADGSGVVPVPEHRGRNAGRPF
ncbi:transposase family protein [Streptomyces sp. NPDC059849]|uniref:transposase family protein n=1 Tax=Streptomyces sp. NPDC059849 TaxID=3346969 RepID=UPI0036626468